MTRPSCATPPPPLCPSCGDRRDAARALLSCHRVLKGPPDTVTRKVTGLFLVEDAWSRACWPLRSWFVCRRECTQPPHPPTPDGPRGPLHCFHFPGQLSQSQAEPTADVKHAKSTQTARRRLSRHRELKVRPFPMVTCLRWTYTV